MKILLRSDGRDDMQAEVTDSSRWIVDAKDAAWAYAQHTGGPVTVIEHGRRVLTVSIEYHDE